MFARVAVPAELVAAVPTVVPLSMKLRISLESGWPPTVRQADTTTLPPQQPTTEFVVKLSAVAVKKEKFASLLKSALDRSSAAWPPKAVPLTRALAAAIAPAAMRRRS